MGDENFSANSEELNTLITSAVYKVPKKSKFKTRYNSDLDTKSKNFKFKKLDLVGDSNSG